MSQSPQVRGLALAGKCISAQIVLPAAVGSLETPVVAALYERRPAVTDRRYSADRRSLAGQASTVANSGAKLNRSFMTSSSRAHASQA